MYTRLPHFLLFNLYISQESFGNKTVTRIHSGISDSYFIQPTSNLLTTSAVLDNSKTLPNASALKTSIQLHKSSSPSAFLRLSSSETVLEGPNSMYFVYNLLSSSFPLFGSYINIAILPAFLFGTSIRSSTLD